MNKFPWIWRSFVFTDKAHLRRVIRLADSQGYYETVFRLVNAARKAGIISADEYAEFVIEYAL